jgi:hypothetical protein
MITNHLSGGGTATTEVHVQEFRRDEPELEPRHVGATASSLHDPLSSRSR